MRLHLNESVLGILIKNDHPEFPRLKLVGRDKDRNLTLYGVEMYGTLAWKESFVDPHLNPLAHVSTSSTYGTTRMFVQWISVKILPSEIEDSVRRPAPWSLERWLKTVP